MITEAKERILKYVRFMFQRGLTDVAGGAISVREGDHIVVTPTGICKQMFQLKVEDLVVCDLFGHIIEGLCKPYVRPSSSFPVHLKIYRGTPMAGSIIHAHPKWVLVYSITRKSIPVVTDQSRMLLGEVPVLKFAEPIFDIEKYVQALSNAASDQVRDREEELKNHGIAMIIPDHGIVTVGKNLHHAYTALEIAEQAAFVVLFGKLLSNGKWPPAFPSGP